MRFSPLTDSFTSTLRVPADGWAPVSVHVIHVNGLPAPGLSRFYSGVPTGAHLSTVAALRDAPALIIFTSMVQAKWMVIKHVRDVESLCLLSTRSFRYQRYTSHDLVLLALEEVIYFRSSLIRVKQTYHIFFIIFPSAACACEDTGLVDD